jgi:hypothetical protein
MEPELEADLLVQVNSEGWRRQSIQAPDLIKYHFKGISGDL